MKVRTAKIQDIELIILVFRDYEKMSEAINVERRKIKADMEKRGIKTRKAYKKITKRERRIERLNNLGG